MTKRPPVKLPYDVCSNCGVLFDDQGENGWWLKGVNWWHTCNPKKTARIITRKLARVDA